MTFRPFALALAFGLATAAQSDPAPLLTAPGIMITDFGIYCSLVRDKTHPAPGTRAGHVRLLPHEPTFVFRQQQIPARLGISFGVASVADRDIPGARIEIWQPGASQPEMWLSDMTAGRTAVRGFTFDHAFELMPGLWRIEAWDGETLLYRVEYEVLPGHELPGVTSDCSALS